MTEYWKSQEKTFCDICKCWLTDNKSSVEFHKNGKRHKENVEKRLKEIQRKNKVDEKKEKRFESDMQRIEKAALAAMQKDSETYADISTQVKLSQSKGAASEQPSSSISVPEKPLGGEARVIHRKEKKVAGSSTASATSTSSGTMGAWKAVTTPTFTDLELPKTNRIIYEPKQPQKRKIEFKEKSLTSIDSSSSSNVTNSWAKVETTTVAFKKRKSGNANVRRRLSDD